MDENLWPRSIYPSIGKTKRPGTLEVHNISANGAPLIGIVGMLLSPSPAKANTAHHIYTKAIHLASPSSAIFQVKLPESYGSKATIAGSRISKVD
jgi:hypothetical protein